MTKTAHKFKWTENELQQVADNMYKQMTSGKLSTIDFWPAFKSAQFSVNPSYKYSVNYQNTDLMKELRIRVTKLFNTACKVKVEVREVITKELALKKALDVLGKIKVNNQPTITASGRYVASGPADLPETFVKAMDSTKLRRLITEEVCNKTQIDTMLEGVQASRSALKASGGLQRKLLTGNVIEGLDHEVDIIITTDCPGKYVIVDLETGEQYSSTGSPVRSSSDTIASAFRSQRKVKPVRKVTIPKPIKGKK